MLGRKLYIPRPPLRVFLRGDTVEIKFRALSLAPREYRLLARAGKTWRKRLVLPHGGIKAASPMLPLLLPPPLLPLLLQTTVKGTAAKVKRLTTRDDSNTDVLKSAHRRRFTIYGLPPERLGAWD